MKSRMRQILDAIEVTGEVPLTLAVELTARGVLRRTWHDATTVERVRWLRARPGALEPLVLEVARNAGFSDAIIEEARATQHDWSRFCQIGQAWFDDPQKHTQYHGWFALGRIFHGTSEMLGSIEDAGLDRQHTAEMIFAAGPPTLDETVAYAATILPIGGRR